jgi:hypothetical protein
MIPGFSGNKSLICEGIVGDGCGGGRLFYIDDNQLQAYDSTTQKSLLLLKNIVEAKKLTKDGCLLFIDFDDKRVVFDLSLLKVIEE